MFTEKYVTKSLELHLFFARIMKEHALFLKGGFTPANAAFARRADYFRQEFERLLSQAVTLSRGAARQKVLCSGEIVTEFTALAEQQTARFTGIPINGDITRRELRLCDSCRERDDLCQLSSPVKRLNQTALRLLDGFIALKESVLKNVLTCEAFTGNYPLLLEHIIREAKLYRDYVDTLECTGELPDHSMQDTECFWNRIMMEHALFIRGLLDPTEEDLICSADGFAKEFCQLLECCRAAYDQTMTSDSLEPAMRLRDFKAAGAEGIQKCEIRSIILPLLADHVLREANHYIRLLQR